MKQLLKQALKQAGLHVFTDDSLPHGADWLLEVKKMGLPKDPIVFDVGANIGQTVAELLAALPSARIFAFEPFGATFAELQRRTANFSNVRAINLALSSESKTVRVAAREQSVLNSLHFVPPAGQTEDPANFDTIAMETIERFCASNSVAHIDILKTDTEGHDLEVLKGAGKLLETGEIRFIYTEVTFCPGNRQNTPFVPVFEFLISQGFRFLGLYETYSLHHFQEPNLYCNALFVHGKHYAGLARNAPVSRPPDGANLAS